MGWWSEVYTQVEGGTIVRYEETENKTGRWAGRGTVERVKWRAISDDPARPISYHNRRKDAVAALAPEPTRCPTCDAPEPTHTPTCAVVHVLVPEPSDS